ncbi:hypothetical protein DVR12_20420 [Chitinophaga silvatica]|uniref:Uncharacterized protein n=1 Tax=Chitinophaga silvatica TaxID=2282649 RepID=A0A3E1Y6B9_9BACT|nr:hypothetical protein [Chitinophaga silvatica]RFS20087.1 hypothetical protein DVR12_20420 [Chitinophaga silvatica]
MAKQGGIIPLKGTIGNITFYKTKAGNLAREKGGVDGNRIANDPAFVRTRENGAEFGRAGKAGKLLRTAFRPLLMNVSDSYVTGRLTRMMVKVIQADATNARGQRNVIDGEAELLKGFEFNSNARLGSTIFAPYTAVIDRAAGTATVNIPVFDALNMVSAPAAATHCKIRVGAAAIDFEAETFVNGYADSSDIALEAAPPLAMSQQVTLTAGSTHPIFLVLGVEFFQLINGALYSLRNGAFNALSMVEVSGLPVTP